MKAVIGVMGSASNLPAGAEKLAFELGRAIARAGCILVTGATHGLPMEAARGAASESGFVVGISPAENRDAHRTLGMPEEAHDFILFSGFGYKGRNILNIRACDAVVTVGGSMGTLNEFTIAFDEGKALGALVGSGGVSDGVEEILRICGRDGKGRIVLEADPAALVAELLEKIGS